MTLFSGLSRFRALLYGYGQSALNRDTTILAWGFEAKILRKWHTCEEIVLWRETVILTWASRRRTVFRVCVDWDPFPRHWVEPKKPVCPPVAASLPFMTLLITAQRWLHVPSPHLHVIHTKGIDTFLGFHFSRKKSIQIWIKNVGYVVL